jgi:hypothetical protein
MVHSSPFMKIADIFKEKLAGPLNPGLWVRVDIS